jgi:catechol 2,3-dioxygenase-like lactoylglutathione lyase family enzyme
MNDAAAIPGAFSGAISGARSDSTPGIAGLSTGQAGEPIATAAVSPSERDDAREDVRIEALSAITLATRDMVRAVRFYCALGFELKHGGEHEAFSTFACGPASYLNLIAETHGPVNWWGRVILHVSDVDALYRRARSAGLYPSRVPEDAPWGERFFHISDPDGHELSFARLLESNTKTP